MSVAAKEDKPEYTPKPGIDTQLREEGEIVTEKEQPKEERELSPREEIYKKYDREQHGVDPESEEENSENLDSETSQEKEVDDTVAMDDKKTENVEKETLTVKINGSERQVEKEKVDAAGGLRAYQKEVSANEKLQKAAEGQRFLNQKATDLDKRERELKEREQAFESKAKQPSSSGDATQKSDPPLEGDQLPKQLAEKAKAYREALISGEDDDDTADKALTDLVLSAQKTSATKEEIAEEVGDVAADKVINRLNAQSYENNRQTALVSFRTDFPEIANDPDLRDKAHTESGKVLQEHPEWKNDPERVIRVAAERTQNWLNKLRGVPSDDQQDADAEEVDTLARKKAEKRALQQPATGSGKTKPQPKGEKTQTRSEYVANLRKKRGLE